VQKVGQPENEILDLLGVILYIGIAPVRGHPNLLHDELDESATFHRVFYLPLDSPRLDFTL
jgi:hypothetical protein